MADRARTHRERRRSRKREVRRSEQDAISPLKSSVGSNWNWPMITPSLACGPGLVATVAAELRPVVSSRSTFGGQDAIYSLSEWAAHESDTIEKRARI